MLRWHIARWKALLSVIMSFVTILAGVSACAQNQSSGPTFTNSTPITIGISLSFTKDFSNDGKAMNQGYQLWADMVNNNGGLLGRPVKLVILNDNSDPDQAATNYRTLITKDHVNLVFGPFSSLLTKAAAPVAQQYGYAFVEGAGGAPSVFSGNWSNLFDVSLPVANNLITFAYYILSLPKADRPRTAAYLTSDDPFTFPQVDLVQKLLEHAGIQTVYPPAGQSDQYAEGDNKAATVHADALARTQPEVTILGTLLPDIQIEVQEFKKAHYNPKAMIATAGPDLGTDFIHAVGGVKYTEGTFVPNGWYPQANNFQNAEMVQAYLAKYGGTADQINADVAEAFSVGQVMQQAAEEAQSIDNAQIIAKLQSGAVFNTVQGTAQFDPPGAADAGQNKQSIAYLFQWQHGQFISVYPYSVAEKNPQYPKAVIF